MKPPYNLPWWYPPTKQADSGPVILPKGRVVKMGDKWRKPRRSRRPVLRRGPYIYNLDAYTYEEVRIPRRHGFWHTTNCKHRSMIAAVRQDVARNSDSPIRDPDRLQRRFYGTYKGRPLMVHSPKTIWD